MPSKSPSQARLMAAAAHTKGGYDGVPQKVGKDFNQADKGRKEQEILQNSPRTPFPRGKLLSNAMKAKKGDSFGLNSKRTSK